MSLNIKASLSESELDELDNFLLSERCPESGMIIDTLDGFLTAIVLTPAPITVNRWLPWVWDMDDGEQTPAFEGAEEAGRYLGLMMRYYNSVVSAIDQGRFEPLFLELYQVTSGDFFDAEGWCEGFIFGIELFAEHWQAVVEQEPDLIEPMMLLGTETGLQFIRNEWDDNPQTIRDIYESIPDAVAALHEYFRPQRERGLATFMSSVETKKSGFAATSRQPQYREPRLGRNDPCPCGSGKEYKKCCGMGEWLH